MTVWADLGLREPDMWKVEEDGGDRYTTHVTEGEAHAEVAELAAEWALDPEPGVIEPARTVEPMWFGDPRLPTYGRVYPETDVHEIVERLALTAASVARRDELMPELLRLYRTVREIVTARDAMVLQERHHAAGFALFRAGIQAEFRAHRQGGTVFTSDKIAEAHLSFIHDGTTDIEPAPLARAVAHDAHLDAVGDAATMELPR